MTLRIGILVYPGVQQLDVTGPYEVFTSAEDTSVYLIWRKLEPIVASSGMLLMPTMNFADCPRLDVLCVPGGSGIVQLFEDNETIHFLRREAARARYLTALCTGSLLLGAAGLLRGKRATTHWYALDFLANFGAVAVPGRIVRDDNLFTAGGVTAGIDFGLAVLAELQGQLEAETVQLMLEYSPAPPFLSGTPTSASPLVLARTKGRLSAPRQALEATFSRLSEAMQHIA